jgi:hypothetical protein
MSVFPGVEEYPLRLPRDIEDSTITNNYSIDDFTGMRPFNWHGRTDDTWMRCPSGEADSVQLNKHRGYVVCRRTGQLKVINT